MWRNESSLPLLLLISFFFYLCLWLNLTLLLQVTGNWQSEHHACSDLSSINFNTPVMNCQWATECLHSLTGFPRVSFPSIITVSFLAHSGIKSIRYWLTDTMVLDAIHKNDSLRVYSFLGCEICSDWLTTANHDTRDWQKSLIVTLYSYVI